MLGLTSYQDSLRALGRVLKGATEVRITERAEIGCVEVVTNQDARELGFLDIENLLVSSHARRGEQRSAGPLSDLLRSVGLALDDLHARNVQLELNAERLNVRFSEDHELSYAGEELAALRHSAAALRNGQPLKRVVILQAGPDTGLHLRELLVAEFAVQSVPTPLARAVAAAAEPPDVVLAQATDGTLDALAMLRTGANTADVPIIVIADADRQLEPTHYFGAGADDVLEEPVQPALLRARVRTWLLRGRGPY